MTAITTHVLDTSLGRPAAALEVSLHALEGTDFRELSRAVTDEDGRIRQFPAAPPLQPGTYRLSFETAAYFAAAARETFFARVSLEFHVTEGSEHYHVPLLLGPFGYTTYRGS